MAGGERSPGDVVAEWHRRAWGDGDLAAIDELIAEPFVRHGISGTSVRSRTDLLHDLHRYRKGLGPTSLEVHDRAVDDDKVWTRATMCGVNLRTGEPRRIQFLQVHRVADGRIVEVWTLHASDVDWDG